MSKAAIYTFRELVNNDEDLQQQIKSMDDYIRVGAEKGMHFTAEELQEVMEEYKDELSDFERGMIADTRN